MKRRTAQLSSNSTWNRDVLIKSNDIGMCKENRKQIPSSWPIYSLVGTAALACYLNGLNGDFVHDDIPAVTLNKDVLAVNPISHLFKNDFWGTPMADLASHKSYRPLTTLTFRLNYLSFGLQPFWFHAINTILHALASMLFTRVVLSVAAMSPQFATLAGLLFAAHPIHTEAVTGIVGRADVLASVFFLTSLLAYHGNINGKYYVWSSIFLGALSMMSKETGVTVLIVNLAYDFYKTWPSIKRTIFEVKWNQETYKFANRALKVLTLLGILLAVRLALLQGSFPKFSQQDNPAAFHPSFYVRLFTFCYLAAFNWCLILCPATLSHDWQMGSVQLVTSICDARNLVTCFIFGLNILLILRSLSDCEAQKHVPVVLGIMILVLSFLPATNLFVTVGFVVAERVLYVPSMGSILLVTYGIQTLWNMYYKHRQTIMCFVILMLITFSFKTVVRNRDWKSRESLLSSGLTALPHNAKMHYNYANFLRDSARPELAKSHYYTALKLWPTYASAHNNLGTILSNKDQAEKHFLAAIRYSSEHVNAHYNLGQLYRLSNRTNMSEEILQRCLRIDPTFTQAYLELARIRGPNDRSVGSLLKTVVQLNQKDPYYGTIYAQWLYNNGNFLEAFNIYQHVLHHSPLYQKAILGAFKYLRDKGQIARLFQLLLRWQSILSIKRSDTILSSYLYLQDWILKNELKIKAKEYDDIECNSTNTNHKHSTKEQNHKRTCRKKSNTNSTKLKYAIRRCTNSEQQNKIERSLSPLVMHQILDSV